MFDEPGPDRRQHRDQQGGNREQKITLPFARRLEGIGEHAHGRRGAPAGAGQSRFGFFLQVLQVGLHLRRAGVAFVAVFFHRLPDNAFQFLGKPRD